MCFLLTFHWFAFQHPVTSRWIHFLLSHFGFRYIKRGFTMPFDWSLGVRLVRTHSFYQNAKVCIFLFCVFLSYYRIPSFQAMPRGEVRFFIYGFSFFFDFLFICLFLFSFFLSFSFLLALVIPLAQAYHIPSSQARLHGALWFIIGCEARANYQLFRFLSILLSFAFHVILYHIIS